ncbi:glycosyltransferase family protein [Singulisphaera acidiphila]|uniref:Bacterial membrane protein YfhO n=1 Tax=Singulisphaera acidiphila (strain ATCC BAA-1392 / DSM 18658 / VKM B-2454 / MOB10) TaxID=886293 RepID=L0DDS3_SINAD|nr:hypothetical protein [Singulisphaera acidiphila]AGA26978.1 hypothetical protein Sinac_2677 [Singulisphaera acidiphila DSM 18658]
MRLRLGEFLAGLIVLSLALICFARLVAEPSGLLVDGERPSVDHAQRDDFRPIGNDLTFFYLPHYTRVADQVARYGRVPHWDPLGFAGRPQVGNPQAGLFYPPLRLIWSLRAPSALGWLTVGHLLWASLGLFVLMRSLGAGLAAATVAAGCFQASPYVLAQVFEGHYPHVWAASWYPWAFWAFLQFRQRRWGRALTLAPILALALLAGHPQEWFYLLFILSLWALWDAVRQGAQGQRRAAFATLAGWSFVVALSLGLAAVELIPDMMAQAWTLRGSHLSLGKVSRYQLHALNVFQLLSPGALGAPNDYFGHDNYWETVLSIGLIPLVLVAVAAARYPDRRLVRGWLILIGGALVFAAGRKLGLFALLFECVPGMNRFRVPSRSLFVVSLGTAVMAGFGVETLALRSFGAVGWQWLARRFRLVAFVVGAFLLGLLPFSTTERADPQAHPDRALSLREIRIFLRSQGESQPVALVAGQIARSGTFWFAIVSVVVILAVGRSSGHRPQLALALGLLGLVELGWAGHGLLKVAPPSKFLGSDPISQALRDAVPPVDGPFRIRARDTLYQDLRASSNGFEKININDSFQIQHAANLYEPLYDLLYMPPAVDLKLPMSEVAAQHRQANRQRILDRMNVAFLVSDHFENNPQWPLVASGTTQGSRFSIHRNPTAMPRAYVVPRAEPVVEDAASALAGFRAVDPHEAVLMSADPLLPTGPRQLFIPAVWGSTDPDRVVIHVTTEAPGLLVVADTWMPGWNAQDNGRPVRLLRGNHAQRVIPLTRAGRHEVILRYEAPGLKRGTAVTLASLSAWIAVFVATLGWQVRFPEFRPSRDACGATTRGSGVR